MEFPASMLVTDLLTNHPEYDAKKLATLKAYYDGGDSFPKAAELRRKPIEESSDPAATPMRKARVNASFYTNYFGDHIADLMSSICRTAIEITDPQERPYWSTLANNADGRKGSATGNARGALLDDLLYNRAFYLVKFPEAAPASNLAAGLEAGNLDAQICFLDVPMVTDWMPTRYGGLKWARVYEMELTRSRPAGPYDTELHRWTYYGQAAIATYTARKECGKDWTKDSTAGLESFESHELGVCPVFKVDRKLKCKVGESLLPTARQLFNEESDGSFYQFVTITGGLFIFTENRSKWAEGLSLTPFGAVLCDATDKIDRDKADAATLTALKDASADRRAQLGGLIHAMARQAAAQSASGQNTSRNTGKAIEKHSQPMDAFLLGFAEPHLATLCQMLDAIANVREEDISDLEVCGLTSCEAEEDKGEELETEPEPTPEPEPEPVNV